MKKRYTLGIYILVVCILLGIGLYSKCNYIDFNTEKKPLNNFTVGVLSNKLVDTSIEVFEESLEQNSIILAVKCEEKSKFYYRGATQKVKIEKVFKGENIKKGDEIEIQSIYSIFMETEENGNKSEANMNFVNEMQIGKIYLVFLDRKIKNTSVYVPIEEGIMKPIFCYEQIKNKPCPSFSSEGNVAWYSDVSENEFFIINQKGIDKIEKFKEQLLKKYQYNY